jgi:molybdopterin-guanine dinucleotide biosynthesis protein A
MSVAVVVLAGGAGSRIGGAKPLRSLGGRPLLAWAVDGASRYGGAMAIGVAAEPWAEVAPGVERIADVQDIEGPLAGLAAGLAWSHACGSAWLQTVPCDAPLLPPDLVVGLLAAAHEAGRAVALPRSRGRLHPACGLWRTDLGEALADYAAQGGRALIGFAEREGHAVAEWEAAALDPFFNVNDAADLAEAERIVRAGQ